MSAVGTVDARTATVIGTGTIGLGWVALFAAAGLTVRVNSRRRDAEDHVREGLELFARSMPDGLVDRETLMARCEFEPDLERSVVGSDIVQENAPEDLALKQDLFARVGAAAPDHALLLSSTSTLLPDDLGASMADPGRLLVAHPFNPPHIVPLVELVPGERTDRRAVDGAVEFYRSLGRTPVVLRRAFPAFVANRLQTALLRESIHLVREGVVSVDELDRIVTASIGGRWAAIGPFRALHLNGGPGGIRHWFDHLGPGLERAWAGLGDPPVDERTIDTVVGQAEAAFGSRTYEQLAAERDAAQTAAIGAVAASLARSRAEEDATAHGATAARRAAESVS